MKKPFLNTAKVCVMHQFCYNSCMKQDHHPPPPPENGLDILELGYVAPLDHIVISNEKTVSTAFLNSLKLSWLFLELKRNIEKTSQCSRGRERKIKNSNYFDYLWKLYSLLKLSVLVCQQLTLALWVSLDTFCGNTDSF